LQSSIPGIYWLVQVRWDDELSREILMEDPSGVYGQMDFVTAIATARNWKDCKNSSLSEEEAVQLAIRLSQEGAALNGDNDRTAHVGYYLIDKGSKKFEALAK